MEFLKSNPFPSRSDLLKASHIETFGSNENYKKHMVDKYNSSMIDKYGEDYKTKIFGKKSLEGKINKHGSLENAMLYMGEQIKKGHNNMTLEQKQSRIENIKSTCMRKYGVDNIFKKQDVIDKRNEKIREYHNSDRFKNKINEYKFEIEKFNNRKDIYSWQRLRDELYPHCDDIIRVCMQNLGMIKYKIVGNEKLLYVTLNEFEVLKKYVCSHNEFSATSLAEREISNYIRSICDYEIIENDRNIIKPKELDIFIPSKKVAIEFDGLRYHSEQFNDDKNYHLNKTLACENQGIRLIHIYEDEWNDKREICKSIIASSLGIYERKIFARKCDFRKISTKDYRDFVNENHIQGYSNAKYKFGLFYNNELVQCIGISKSRFCKNEMELIRMCTKLNTQVIGGFSKLMMNQPYEEIISYVDRRLFNGKGYESSSWKIIKYNSPSYYYFNHGKRENRLEYQKHKLKDKLSVYDETLSEHDNMMNNKIYRIYDCGTIKVKFTKK